MRRRFRKIDTGGVDMIRSCQDSRDYFEIPLSTSNKFPILLPQDFSNFTKHRLYVPSLYEEDPTVKIDIEGILTLLNEDQAYPHLSFEESLFPTFAIVVLVILALCSILLLASVPFCKIVRSMRPPLGLLLTLLAVTLKVLSALVTFLFFLQINSDGIRRDWLTYERISLGMLADIAYIACVGSLVTGYAVFPEEFFPDVRSVKMFTYLLIGIQTVQFITVKFMFPFRFLGELMQFSALVLSKCVHRFLNAPKLLLYHVNKSRIAVGSVYCLLRHAHSMN